MASAALLFLLFGGAEPQAALTEALKARDPAIRALIEANPGIERGWEEPFWADALLNAPMVPGTRWRVHDLSRPQPPAMYPGFENCPARPAPAGAMTLFNGGSLDAWTGDRVELWSTGDGELRPSGHKSNRLHSRQSFGDVELHLEFRMPDPPTGVFQARGNSGLFFQQRYEVQILDSWQNPTYPDGQMGALYGQVPPLANASLPPGRWQCLDIRFTAPRFTASGALASPARATVRLNGVLLQDSAAFLGPTAFASIGTYAPHGAAPLSLQDHGDAGGRIAFRQVWAQPIP